MISDADMLRRRNRELSILNAIAEALNHEVDLTRALHTALAQVGELLDLQTGWVWLLDDASGQPYLAATQHLPPALEHDPTHFDGTCYCLDTYELGRLEGATNVSFIRCTRLKNLIEGGDGLLYHASIPLMHHDRKVGVLNVARRGWEELSDDDLRLLSTVGDLLSIAIERAQLFARSTELGAVEERNRLAREIHDTLAQGLAGIALLLDAADTLLPADPVRAADAVRRALALTRQNLDEARRSVLDLRAAPLEGRTLPEALARLAADYADEWGLDVRFTLVGGARPLPVRLQTGLYRIAQEAMTNVVRHAHAAHAALTLVTTPERVELRVEDDGRGFDPAVQPAGRFGLVGLAERVRLLDGVLHITSAPNAGTTLHALLPISDTS